MFKPSQSLLQTIGFDNFSYYQHTMVPVAMELGKIEGDIIPVIAGTIEHIKEFYNYNNRFAWKNPLRCTRKSLAGAQTWYILLEGLRNSKVHGSKPGESYTWGMWLCREGVCFGFQDRGGYFRREDIKHMFENRMLPQTVDREGPLTKSCRGKGLDTIYKLSDLIEVDTTEGVLYIAQSAQRFFVEKKELEEEFTNGMA